MSSVLALFPVAPESQADDQLCLGFFPLCLFSGFVASVE